MLILIQNTKQQLKASAVKAANHLLNASQVFCFGVAHHIKSPPPTQCCLVIPMPLGES